MGIKNKRGAEMAIGTLVVIVLAVLVLVVLALGFTTGWSNLYSRMTSFFSSVNVDSVAQACSVAAVAQNKYDYCCSPRSIRFASGKEAISATCKELSDGVLDKPADQPKAGENGFKKVVIETKLDCK